MASDLIGMVVMALLSERPRHPYDLLRELRQRHLEFIAPQSRALYHAVDRLAKQELIEPAETTREGNRPERTVYRLTDEGRDEFRSRLHAMLDHVEPEYTGFSVAAGFMCYLTMDDTLDALRGRVAGLEAGIAALEAVHRSLEEERVLPRLVLLSLEVSIVRSRAELEWVRTVIDDIRAGRLEWDRHTLFKWFGHAGFEVQEGAVD